MDDERKVRPDQMHWLINGQVVAKVDAEGNAWHTDGVVMETGGIDDAEAKEKE